MSQVNNLTDARSRQGRRMATFVKTFQSRQGRVVGRPCRFWLANAGQRWTMLGNVGPCWTMWDVGLCRTMFGMSSY